MDDQQAARQLATPLQLVRRAAADVADSADETDVATAARLADAAGAAPVHTPALANLADPPQPREDPLRLLARERLRNRWLRARLRAAQAALAQAQEHLRQSQLSEHEARRRACEDSLTLLHNQAAFRERLHGALARRGSSSPSGALALLYLDLDRFKAVNDRHGHEVGDALLRIVAARLQAALRSSDSVGRMGGDEFACLVTDLPDHTALAQLVHKLLVALAAPVAIGPVQLVVQASLGVAVWPADGDTGAALLRHADQAMYRAKRHGGGAVFFGGALRPA